MSRHPSVVICADDFGMSDGISSTIAELLRNGASNATTCLVNSPAWPLSVSKLRFAAAGLPIAIGLHLDLPSPWTGASAALVAFRAQWRRFEQDLGQIPDFVDGHRHVHLFPGPRRAVFELMNETGAHCWLRQCRTSSSRANVKRLVLDPLSRLFSRQAKVRRYEVNPGFGGLRRFDPAENIAEIWRRDLEGMKQGGVLMTHPGPIDPADPLSACRAQEAALLASGAMSVLLAQCNLSLAGKNPWSGARADFPSSPER